MKYLFFLLPSVLNAAIAFDSAISVFQDGGGAQTSKTWNHTIGTGDNRVLFVTVGGLGATDSAAGDPTITTIAGVSVNLIRACNSFTCQIWYLINPPPGTLAITVSFPNMPNGYERLVFGSVSFSGVNPDTITPLASINVIGSTTNTISTSVTTTINNTWLIGVACEFQGTIAAANGQTEIFNNANGTEACASGYFGPKATGSVTMGWTATGGGGDGGIVLVAFSPFVAYPTSTGYQNSNYVPGPRPRQTDTLTINTGPPGDTQYFAWTGSWFPGPWNGGTRLGSYNDGTGLGCGSSNICIYKLLTYVSGTSATFAAGPSMTSYGGSSAVSCYDGIHQMKNRKLFAWNGALYIPIYAMSDGSPYTAFQSGLIKSPDGIHTCNYKTYQSGGNAGPNSCDIGNWKSDGDNPVDAAGFQWPLADGTNKMTRMMIVDFLTQDNLNQPVAPNTDMNYLYFSMSHSDLSVNELYMSRVAKSTDIMLPGNYQNWVTNAYVAATQINATNVKGSITIGTGVGSISYLANFGLFVFMDHSTGSLATSNQLLTSTNLTSGWVRFPDYIHGEATILGFPSIVKCDPSAGRMVCTLAGNGGSNADLKLKDFDFGPTPPVRVH